MKSQYGRIGHSNRKLLLSSISIRYWLSVDYGQPSGAELVMKESACTEEVFDALRNQAIRKVFADFEIGPSRGKIRDFFLLRRLLSLVFRANRSYRERRLEEKKGKHNRLYLTTLQ